MTPRERVMTAVALRQPDRTPADYKAEPEVNEWLTEHHRAEPQYPARHIDPERARDV